MTCKVLFFEYGNFEKKYFELNGIDSIFDMKFIEAPLTESTDIDDLREVSMISISKKSVINSKVLDKFKNLRLISTRTLENSHIDLKECFNRNIAVVGVEKLEHTNEYILKNSFAGMKSFLCGGKDNRIV